MGTTMLAPGAFLKSPCNATLSRNFRTGLPPRRPPLPMTQPQSKVEQAVREAFPTADHEAIMALLNTYGTEPYERERERVQLTIVRICQGDASKLRAQVEMAKVDYRDILVFANRPLPTPEEAAADLAAAREVLRLWGKK